MGIQYILLLAGRESEYPKVLEYKQQRDYLCYSTSRYENDYTITQYGWANGILPIPYVTWSSSPNGLIALLCRSLSIKQDKKSPQHYVITATWSSEPLTQAEKEEQQIPNPLDRPPKIRWKTGKYNKAIFKDIHDKAILNSAGEFFDPVPEVDRSRWSVYVSANVAAVPSFMIDYTDGINENAISIQGLPIGEQVAKLMDMEVGEVQTSQYGDTEIPYVIFTWAAEMRPETWALNLLDQGMRQIDPNDATKRIAVKDDATPPKEVHKPWPLDGSGNKLANPSPTNAVQLSFDVYNPIAFEVLPGVDLE